MTLAELQEVSRKRTEAIIGAWTDKPTGQTKKLLNNYRVAYNEIDEQLKAFYAKNLAGIKKEDMYNEAIKLNRLENLQKQIKDTYNKAARKAGLAQFEMSKTAISNQYYQNMYAVNWFSGLQGVDYYTHLNPKIATVSVFGTEKIFKSLPLQDRKKYKKYMPKAGTVVNSLRGNQTDDLRKIQETITRGLIQGKKYTEMTKDLRKVFNTTASNAMRIARTESARNMNAGALANTEAAINKGVEMGREVVEVEDSNTRAQSSAINRQKQKGADPFIYPGGLKVDIIGNSGVAEYDINERGTSVDFIQDVDANTIKGINPVTGKHSTANMGAFNEWMKENDLIYKPDGRITSKGKTAF